MCFCYRTASGGGEKNPQRAVRYSNAQIKDTERLCLSDQDRTVTGWTVLLRIIKYPSLDDTRESNRGIKWRVH